MGKYLGEASWDGRSSQVIAVNWQPGAILIFQPEPKRLLLAKFGQDLHFATGNPQNPIGDLASLTRSGDGARIIQVLSIVSRLPIKNYFIFADEMEANWENLQKFFKKFASPVAPFAILAGSYQDSIGNTNLTRRDLISLWWQVKSLSIDNLRLVDLQVSEPLVVAGGGAVLGVDSVSLKRIVGQYLENRELVEEGIAVFIQNASDVAGAGRLAADFVTSVGGRVAKIETQAGPIAKSQIIAQKTSYTANYLAKIFECGIKTESGADSEITVIVGSDFAQKYLF